MKKKLMIFLLLLYGKYYQKLILSYENNIGIGCDLMTFPDFLIILFLSILIIIILFLYYELSKRIQKNIETFEEKNHDLKNTNTKIKKNHSELKNKIGKNKEITGLLESFNIELEEEISCLEEKICSLEKKNIGVKDRNEELVGGVSDAKCYMENIGLLKDHIETKWKGFNNLDVKVGVCEKSLKLFEGSNKELEDEILYLKEKIHDLEEKNEEVKLNLSNINLNDLKFQVLNANIMKKFSINTDNLKKNYVRFSHINALKKEVSAMNKLYDKILSISNYNLLKFSVKFIDDWNFYGYLINNFEDCNNEYVKNEIEINKNYFSNINNALNENEKISLDDDQRYSLVVNDDNNLIIAGAGSGKTLTIVSKIKYLIEKKHANPDEIFVFSFSNASVNDLKEKIKKLNIKNINHLNVSTFHKKGLDILKKNNFADERKLEKVANEGELDKVIDVFFFKALQNKDLVKKIIDFFVEIFPMNFQYPNSLAKLAEIQRNYDFETIKSKYKNKDKIQLTLKEEVRSVEELLIANFLFLNGIEYKYESLYDPLKTFNSIKTQGEWENEKYWVKKYKPTFFLPAYNIYLEHFGIDENEKVNWLSESGGKHYVKKMYDKRKIHEKYKTKLLETYSYFGNDLLEKLKEILIVNGVKLREIDYSILYEVLIENNNLNFDLKRLISSFIKLFKSSGFKEEKFLEFKDQNNEEEKSWLNKKNEFLLDIIHLIYVDYQKYLSSNKKIDFNDMINNASEIIKQKGTDEKYSYLIIDEFQDMSFARKEFIKAIQEKNGASVTVVGDDWQSIYRFAGSQLLLFTEFEKDFHNHQELFIRNNYRNPQNLINI
ncbi:MAG: UvrD-helicase domain-containing protein, partial [Methanobrevibacter sp.]|nr:UvrD-helicase domain-containing protein [Methanobrevibacter sp.]